MLTTSPSAVDPLVLGLHRVPVDGDPVAVAGQARLAHDTRRAVRRHVDYFFLASIFIWQTGQVALGSCDVSSGCIGQ
jgi:hypothetical protein